MIVVVGRVQTDADRREELIRLGQTLAAASRQDEGCISYRLYEDTEQPNEFVFIEEWEDDNALQRHFGTPHIGAFMRAIPAAVLAPPDVKFHTIASSRSRRWHRMQPARCGRSPTTPAPSPVGRWRASAMEGGGRPSSGGFATGDLNTT